MNVHVPGRLLACSVLLLPAFGGPDPGPEPVRAGQEREMPAELRIPLSPRPAWMLVPAREEVRPGSDLVLVARVTAAAGGEGELEHSGSARLAVGPRRTVELHPDPPHHVPADAGEALALLLRLYPRVSYVEAYAVPPAPPGDAAARSFEFALRALRLQAAVEDDPRETLELCEVALFSASNAALFEGQERALAQVALERARALARLGRTEAALAAAAEVLLTGPRPATPEDGAAVPADAKLLAVARRAAQAPELAALRRELEGELGAQRPRAGQDRQPVPEERARGPQGVQNDDGAVARYVREHFGAASAELDGIVRGLVAGGGEQAILDIGRAAAPVLAAIVLGDLDRADPLAESQTGHRARDPLVLLWRIDPEGCGALIADHLDAGGLGWRLRLLETLEASGVLTAQGNLDARHWNGRQCLHPVWLDVLARLLASPDTTRRATPFVRSVVRRDALTPALADAAEGVARSAAEEAANLLLAELEPSWRLESAVPLWERLLDHPRPDLRTRAVLALGRFEPTPRLLSAAEDDSPEVRAALARALARRRVTVRTIAAGATPGSRRLDLRPLAAGEAAVDALRALLGDGDPGVRAAAFAAWLDEPDDSTRLTLLPAVAEHMTAAQRAQAVELLGHAYEASGARVLLAFADDPDDAVVAAVDEQLLSVGFEEPDAIAAIRTRLSDRERPFGFRAQGGELAVRLAVHNLPQGAGLAGVAALLAGCRAQGDWRWMELLAPNAVGSFQRFWVASGSDEGLPALAAADLESLVRWVCSLADPGARLLAARMDPLGTVAQDPRGPAALRAAALDASLPGEGRLIALRHASWRSLGADPELARAVLLGIDWRSEPELARSDSLRQLRPGDAAGVALALELGDAPLPPEALWRLEAGFEPAAPGARALRDRILARWRERGEGLPQTIGRALEALALDGPDDVDPELLLAAARDPELVAAAVRAMGKLRDPLYLPALEAALLGEGAAAALPEHQRIHVQESAIEALTAYLSPEAAAALRRGLGLEAVVIRQGRPTPIHTLAQAGLERIRRYHEEEARWAAGSAPLERRDAARELVALLGAPSPAVRAEAARGLATLGAVEALPKLIPLLEDGEPAVRQAARDALDRLHATPAPAPDPSGGV